MVLTRLAAGAFALTAAITPAIAHNSIDQQLAEIYTRGYIQGRPLYTEFYDALPSAYFPGLPNMKKMGFDRSGCKPIFPDHVTELGLEPLPGYEPAFYDCSQPKRTVRAPLEFYHYLPLYPFLDGRNISIVTADAQQHSIPVLPARFVGQHPYDIRSESVTLPYNPWYNR